MNFKIRKDSILPYMFESYEWENPLSYNPRPFFKRGGVIKQTSLLWLRLETAIKLYGYVEIDGKIVELHDDGISIGEMRENSIASRWVSLQDYKGFIYKQQFLIQPNISDVCKIYKILKNYQVPKDIETLALIKLGA